MRLPPPRSPASVRFVVFASRRGAERAQRLIELIDELLPTEVDRQSKREVHGDKIRFEMSPALSCQSSTLRSPPLRASA